MSSLNCTPYRHQYRCILRRAVRLQVRKIKLENKFLKTCFLYEDKCFQCCRTMSNKYKRSGHEFRVLLTGIEIFFLVSGAHKYIIQI